MRSLFSLQIEASIKNEKRRFRAPPGSDLIHLMQCWHCQSLINRVLFGFKLNSDHRHWQKARFYWQIGLPAALIAKSAHITRFC